ncbi:Cpe/LpqF family protein [uncultured Cellulomonas sp.]|uniref:Cpe/LpqF family protein n=1 Tax=uncultured Cellulomonas sp. TaxID=189682 RepID=UPI0026115B37|nr:Cpe/LpqF family protein [uncultured Cellulomonas sp.]
MAAADPDPAPSRPPAHPVLPAPPGRRRRRPGDRVPHARVAVVVGLVTLGVAGCSGPSSPAEPSSPGAVTASPGASAVALPDDAAGRQARWVLDQLAPGAQPSEADVSERFGAEFVASVPPARLLEIVDGLRAAGPWTATEVRSSSSGVAVRLAGPDGDLLMELGVDAAGRVAGLLFSEPAPPRDPAASWEDLLEEVRELPAQTSFLVAAVQDGACVPVAGTPAGSAPDAALPIGSMVKLYVLGAVVDAVGRGDLTWDTELTVTHAVRSLPSGELQDAPTGTVVTVRESAEKMIAISDNTATDLLVQAVGRDRVEAAVADMGHSDPGALVPLPTTRELFWLGWGGGAQLRERWREADTAGRRAILSELPEGPLRVDTAALPSTAVWPDGVDWTATATDLCAAHVALAERAGTPHGAPVTDVLTANPGIEVDPARWPSVAFKGGSSTGTMGGSWAARDADGDLTVVVLQTAAEEVADAVAAGTMVGIAQDAFRLVD